MDQDDPTKDWSALKQAFVQQKASSCFVAYDKFFSIRKCPEEFMLRIKDLCSSSFDIATLRHRQVMHYNTADIKSLVECNLVTRMRIDSKSTGDPICKPCLTGKMHANPFTTSQNCASCPLKLVHSDVHQVPYQTFSGYQYWVTFIDDYLRYQFVIPICAKSDLFNSFKQFKAFAENQTK